MYDVKPCVSVEPSDCGAASMVAFLGYYGKEVTLDQMRKECNVKISGCTGLDLKRVGNAHGLDMRPFRIDDADYLLKMDRPAIVHWKHSHWVVFCGVNDAGKVVICNPNRGRYGISKGLFKAFFSGTVLFNGEPEEIPPEEEFTDADVIETLADLDYRVCLLELGINENGEEL